MLVSILMAAGFGFGIAAVRHGQSYARAAACVLLVLNSLSLALMIVYLLRYVGS